MCTDRFRTLHIEAAVADHHHLIRIAFAPRCKLGQHLCNHFFFVHSSSVQLASDHDVEIFPDSEMHQNILHINGRFARCNRQRRPGCLQIMQKRSHSGIQHIFVFTGYRKPLPVLLNCLLRLLRRKVIIFHKALCKRRSDKRLQPIQLRFFNPKASERILHTTANSLFRIADRSVQVK